MSREERLWHVGAAARDHRLEPASLHIVQSQSGVEMVALRGPGFIAVVGEKRIAAEIIDHAPPEITVRLTGLAQTLGLPLKLARGNEPEDARREDGPDWGSV